MATSAPPLAATSSARRRKPMNVGMAMAIRTAMIRITTISSTRGEASLVPRRTSHGSNIGRSAEGVEPDGLLEVVPELLGPGGVAELGQRLRLDLADPLPGHAELPADLLEGPGVPVHQPEPELDHLLLPLRQRVEDRLELLLEEDEGGRVDRHDRLGVLDEVAEVG